MPSVQVKHVPDDVLDVLKRRAAARHQSLQEFMLDRLTDEARTPTLDDVLDRVEQFRGGRAPLDEVVALVRADRDRA